MAGEISSDRAASTAVLAGQGPGGELVPTGFRLRPDPGTRTLAGGTVLTGGYPIRVLRLSPAGARHVAGWWDGAPVPGSAKARALARRLLDTGIAHPLLDQSPAEKPAVTAVVPVRDRHAELARCLAGLTGPGASRALRVIVVDDGSADPAAIQSVAAAAGTSVVRRPLNGGPAAARNTGLAAARTPLVAFLDSDCVPGAGPAKSAGR
ncbi:MAG TPA: glycosyltransferase [Streptosporangiaceae bacterium]|nr:glycosyltransferase [Streptosporangiaceae bacterium]